MEMLQHGIKERLRKWAAVAGLVLGICLGLGLQAGNGVWAQTTSGSETGKTPTEIINSAKNTGFDVTVVKEQTSQGENNVFVIKTVNQKLLAQLGQQRVRVQGVISTYDKIKQSYRFSTDDSSAVWVTGEFPQIGHTRWQLDARVISGTTTTPATLSEITKLPCNGADACSGTPARFDLIKWVKDNSLVAAGILLVLIALIVLVSILIRNKKAEEARVKAEQQAKAEAARREELQKAEEERRRREVESRNQKSNGGGTVNISNGSNDRSKTLVSIGSLKCLHGTFNGQSFPLIPGTTRIGRDKSAGNDIVLDSDRQVSKSHGSIIIAADGRVIYEDVSTNGTTVNGQLVSHNKVDIRPGAKLEIGSSTFEVVLPTVGSRPATPVATPAQPAGDPRQAPTMRIQMPAVNAPAGAPAVSAVAVRAAAPTAISFGAELEVIEGAEKGQHFPITKTVTTFGREKRDMMFTDTSISRSHATLSLREGKFILTDDGSSHGTIVNGEAVKPEGCELHNNDEIVFGSGNTKIKFRSING